MNLAPLLLALPEDAMTTTDSRGGKWPFPANRERAQFVAELAALHARRLRTIAGILRETGTLVDEEGDQTAWVEEAAEYLAAIDGRP